MKIFEGLKVKKDLEGLKRKSWHIYMD